MGRVPGHSGRVRTSVIWAGYRVTVGESGPQHMGRVPGQSSRVRTSVMWAGYRITVAESGLQSYGTGYRVTIAKSELRDYVSNYVALETRMNKDPRPEEVCLHYTIGQ